ncbi:MAG TPA: type I pullulanase [Candidatus Faecalibacterium intestinigallinarum]|uniref:Type I pullulanase n=1 Tax=Candidatus Faecalibacterium intestinigallinarum TaxID=2838581 RepID=A0A9D1QBD6_9FIRM|nr:type I pullulanase [Candidatus Faecalibacterium intestinigallinarum]
MQTATQPAATRRKLYDSKAFEAQYHTDEALGALWTPAATRFALWAPTARQVSLSLYAEGTGGGPLLTVDLARGGRGVWEAVVEGDLDGRYYDFAVTDCEGVTRRTADPWARACGRDGARSMVIDLRRTDPAGWAEDAPPARGPEDIIWEVHVKDFSHDARSGVPAALRGKFKALTLTGTTLDGDGVHPTCLDYLKRLGVNYVQLMPVFDYGSVPEDDPEAFNWGYDPVNYNVPEGSYATDPDDGAVRIRELKEAIQALHQNGFRVIMDVVYNHTYHLDSWLWRTEPWYFYRQNPDGSPADGSGCGNDLASERSMCARYILESVLYWAQEYHMDGFRFDLMALLDTQLMERVRAELDRAYGKGEKLVFGEPWSAHSSPMHRGAKPAGKRALPTLDENIGAFCDATRDLAKGHILHAERPGFVNGGSARLADLRAAVTGWAGAPGGRFAARAASQTINYLSSHDDWTLWDKLVLTMDPARQFDTPTPAVLRANRLAAAFCFGCQGRWFMLAGEEFGRTKQGLQNSFNASAALNQLDWARAWTGPWRDLADYYRGLIALRPQLPGLCSKGPDAPARLRSAWRPARLTAAFLLDNSGPVSRWDALLLFYSAAGQPRPAALPDGQWQVLADPDSSFRWQEAAPALLAGQATLPAAGALILGRVGP